MTNQPLQAEVLFSKNNGKISGITKSDDGYTAVEVE